MPHPLVLFPSGGPQARTIHSAIAGGRPVYQSLVCLLGLAYAGAFLLFRPVAYGMLGPRAGMRHLEWSRHWELTA